MNQYNNEISSKMMLAFEGRNAPKEILEFIGNHEVGGFTIFREINVENATQLKDMISQLQSESQKTFSMPLLMAVDQETGQFLGIGNDTTQFIGNMAIGAVNDEKFAEEIAFAIGKEMRAIGFNINYAPVCDVSTNAKNPGLGIRTFSDNPETVARLSSAMVRGFQNAGVVSTLKHFPGKGEASVDSHHEMPIIDLSRDRLENVELVPFKRGIEAGAKLIMTGHFAIPVLNKRRDLPATLSKDVMTDFLRDELNFNGVIITDALDMKALSQGEGQIIDTIAALNAGVDLLLFTKDLEVQRRIFEGLKLAVSRELINNRKMHDSSKRIEELKKWVSQFEQPSLDIVGCEEHQSLSRKLANRSVTLVKNESNLVPLNVSESQRIVVILPKPVNLTPADTSQFVKHTLASEIRRFHNNVFEIIVDHFPSDNEIDKVINSVNMEDICIIGTINSYTNTKQTKLVKRLLNKVSNSITVSLRIPNDITNYQEAHTNICTYSILPHSMEALAKALFGEISFMGKLPVFVDGINESKIIGPY